MPRRALLYSSDKRPRASLEAVLAEEHECCKREKQSLEVLEIVSQATVRQKLVLRMYTFMPPRLPIASEYDVEDRSRYLQTSAHQYSNMMRRNHARSFLTKDRRRSMGRCARMNIIDMK